MRGSEVGSLTGPVVQDLRGVGELLMAELIEVRSLGKELEHQAGGAAY